MRIATDDDLARRPQTVLDDHVVQAAGAGIEHVSDAVRGGKAASFRQNLRITLRGRRKGVIEDENDARRIEDFAASISFSKTFTTKLELRSCMHHAIHVGDDHFAGRDLLLPAGLGENFLDHVHRSAVPSAGVAEI